MADTDTGDINTIDEATDAIETALDDTPEDAPGDEELDQGAEDATDEDFTEESEEATDELEAEDDVVEEEAEEDGADEDEREAATPPLNDETTVVMGDGTAVKLGELKGGYLRQQDYTQKTESLAADRSVVEETASILIQERSYYHQSLTRFQEMLGEQGPSEPPPLALASEDGLEYTRLKAEWDAKQQKIAEIQKEREQFELANREREAAEAKAEKEQKEVSEQTKFRDESAKLLVAIPSWNDDEVAEADKAVIRSYGHEIGYSDEEIDSVVDHRTLVMARDAARYRALMAKRKVANKKSRNAPPVTKPGTTGKTKGRVSQDKVKQANDSGTLDDAAAAVESALA